MARRLVTDAEVHATVRRRGTAGGIATAAGDFGAKLVVNAAGLFGDRVERLRGVRPGFTVRPRKGQFVVFDKPAHDLVNAIILKVPTRAHQGRALDAHRLRQPAARTDRRGPGGPHPCALRRGRAAPHHARRAMRCCPSLPSRPSRRPSPGCGPRPSIATMCSTSTSRQRLDHRRAASARPGLSASLGLGEWAAENGSATARRRARAAPPDDDLDWPRHAQPQRSPRRAPTSEPGRSPIVCHCEWVTESEIRAALAVADSGRHARRPEAPHARHDGALPGFWLQRRGAAARPGAFSRRLSLTDEPDVLVVGAGPAGLRRRACTGRAGDRSRSRRRPGGGAGRHPALLPARDLRPDGFLSPHVGPSLCRAPACAGRSVEDPDRRPPSPRSAASARSSSRAATAGGHCVRRASCLRPAFARRRAPRAWSPATDRTTC